MSTELLVKILVAIMSVDTGMVIVAAWFLGSIVWFAFGTWWGRILAWQAFNITLREQRSDKEIDDGQNK